MAILKGKTAVVTGAKGGLGSFVTNALLEAGASVCGISRSIEDSDFPSPHFFAISGDLTKAPSAGAAIAAATEKLKKIDIAIHLMGTFEGGRPIAESDPGLLDRMITANLTSTWNFAQAVLPAMQAGDSGRFIAVGSRAAVEPGPGVAAYAASKAAVVALVRSLAAENKKHKITANILLPGTIDTPANRSATPEADFSHWVQPSRLAAIIVSLCSDDYAEVSGASIPVYGNDL